MENTGYRQGLKEGGYKVKRRIISILLLSILFWLSFFPGLEQGAVGNGVYGKTSLHDSLLDKLLNKKPQPIPSQWKGIIGKYKYQNIEFMVIETKVNLNILYQGKYYPLEGDGKSLFELSQPIPFSDNKEVRFTPDGRGFMSSCRVGEITFERKFYGTETGSTFKITPLRSVEELRKEVENSSPPVEWGEFKTPQLVEVVILDKTIKLDIRYATDNNFMGTAFYSQPRAFLQKPAAEAVVRVNKRLNKIGYGLLIFDAYRPWSVTKMFWEATPPSQKEFVADPSKGSRHNRGTAVDLTLYDLKTGNPVEMTGEYDEFTERSYPDYPGGTDLQRWNRELLRACMEDEKFIVNPAEWWHFDYYDYQSYPIMNIPFEEIP